MSSLTPADESMLPCAAQPTAGGLHAPGPAAAAGAPMVPRGPGAQADSDCKADSASSDAPMVHARSGPRLDANGKHQICEIPPCITRVNRMKTKRPFGNGHACRECIDALGKTDEVEELPVAPKRSHKRGGSQSSSSSAEAAASSSSSASSASKQEIARSLATVEQKHWRLDWSQPRTLILAAACWTALVGWLAWARATFQPEQADGKWVLLRGGGTQTHFSWILSVADEWLRESLLRRLAGDERAVRAILRRAIGSAESKLKLACSALLEFTKGCTQQELHMDIPNWEHASKCWVVIVYLTDSMSTFLPLKDETTRRLWMKEIAAEGMRVIVAEDNKQFGSWPVEPARRRARDVGTDGALRPPVKAGYRAAAYYLFSPDDGCEQALDQRYPCGV